MRQVAGGDFLGIEEIDRYAHSPQPRVPAAHVVAIVMNDIAIAGLKEVIRVFVHQQGDLRARRLRLRKELALRLNRRAEFG